jgi:lipopolysaccharide transport system ATP-binding protein
MAPAICVENLSKLYRLGPPVNHDWTLLSETLTQAAATRFSRQSHGTSSAGNVCSNGVSSSILDRPTSTSTSSEFWALKDVSFDVQPGEVVGIIGRNGAGKSTLLKILSRITEPTTGRIALHGRVGSLLEVGTGFHPELTGRENIYLNGAILGMSRKEIKRRFDEIVDFSGIQQLIDTPVKRYSSGMYVRLAFAVAAHLDPEILIVDEVLAVGDTQFQSKCLGKIRDVACSGRTVFFVSHNLAAIRHLCSRCILFANGVLAAEGDVNDVVHEYLWNTDVRTGGRVELRNHCNRSSQLNGFFESLELKVDGECSDILPMGSGLTIELTYSLIRPPANLLLAIQIVDSLGQLITSLSPKYQAPNLFVHTPQRGVLRCSIPRLNLISGQYSLNIRASDSQGQLDWIDDACRFTICDYDVFHTGRVPLCVHGINFFEANWSLMSGDAQDVDAQQLVSRTKS